MTTTSLLENISAMHPATKHPHPDEPQITQHYRRLPNGGLVEILSNPDAENGGPFSAPVFVEGDGRDFINMLDAILAAFQSVADEARFDGHVEWELPSGRILVLPFAYQEPITATIR